MTPYRQIRADYNRDSIVVYQAYHKEIANPAIKAGRFVEPFSWGRMTWIKPSFLWLMARSNWGSKSRQEHILAVRIKRDGWEQALGGQNESKQPVRFPKRQIHTGCRPGTVACDCSKACRRSAKSSDGHGNLEQMAGDAHACIDWRGGYIGACPSCRVR